MTAPTHRSVVFRVSRPQLEETDAQYTVPVQNHTTVIDALEWIRYNLDETLLYRHSCHHGSCGTCGMIINGNQALACTTRVLDLVEAGENAGAAPTVEVSPLQTMRHIADLAVDPTSLFSDFPANASYLRESEANRGSEVPAEIARFVRFENCIECGLCVSSCPVITIRVFTGPAALSAYNREIEKNPDRAGELLSEIDTERGVWGCDRHLECSRVCPTGVYPAKHIVQLQKKIRKARAQ